jgi:hypothetical protein
VKSTCCTICVALGSLLLAVGIAASSAQADVLDSATIIQSCSSYTIKVTGHALSHPTAYVLYDWGRVEGLQCRSVPSDATVAGVTDILSVTPKADQTFTASATRPQPIPPFGGNPCAFFGDTPSATLVTGATTWNSVYPFFIPGPSLSTISCPSLNKCPRAQNYWIGRQKWPVTGLVLGNLFPSIPYPTTITYNNQRALAILNTPGGTDESMVLAHQLIAAKLNLFNGAPRIVHNAAFGSPNGAESIFKETVNADFLLGSLTSNPIPQHVDPTSALGQRMASEAAILKSYNTGAFTPQSPDGTCHDALP